MSPASTPEAGEDARDGHRIDLPALAKNLGRQVGKIRKNPYLIQFSADGCEITLFADGRALIKGTEDINRARSLYSRYVGN